MRMKLKDETLNELEVVGVSGVPGAFSRKLCAEVIKEFDIHRALKKKLHVDQLPCENRIWRAEKISSKIAAILDSDLVRDVSVALNQKPEFAIVNHVWAGNGPGSGGGWHRDTRLGPQYKIIIYLSDCRLGNGEYWYIPRSHKILSIFSILRFSELFRKPRYDKIPFLLNLFAKKLPGKAGDVIITNTVGLHRGSKVVEGERFAVTIYFENGVNNVG